MASVVAFLRRDERGFEGDRVRVDRGDGGGEQGSGGNACKDVSDLQARRGRDVVESAPFQGYSMSTPYSVYETIKM